ncbi:MAG TPA: alpha/beta fold hydrolase [Acidobacteriaceae bacterium]|nr:alpha/beta fold hydrolase [Acidobacteriaceae bacterium]
MRARRLGQVAVLCGVSAIAVCGQAPADGAAKPGFDVESYRKLDATLEFLRQRNARDYAIDTKRGIDEASFVPIGGIEQWVTIRGQDRSNPVLLFVHGGPGDVTSLFSLPYFYSWEKKFTVVEWDQRGAGRTFGKSGPSVKPTMTLDRIAQDGTELAEYLCKHLGKRKIVVVAHSFGTILALKMVQMRPELFAAYVGTGQVADETRDYTVAYGALLKKAEGLHNDEAMEELKAVGPPPYKDGRGYQVQRKWSNRFEHADTFLAGTMTLSLSAPGYTVRDVLDDFDGQSFSGEALVPQARSQTMRDLGLQFKVPMFFFEGTEDFTTPTALAREYLQALHAPVKEFVPVPGGHFAVFMNSDEFLRQLVVRVKPLAEKAG